MNTSGEFGLHDVWNKEFSFLRIEAKKYGKTAVVQEVKLNVGA
jgi:hypothetical protein